MTGAGLRSWLEDRRSNARREGGVVAVIVAFLAVVLLSIAAFTVDVGSWYVEGHREQRAADAAALAGVVYLPGNPAKATATALKYAAANGYDDADPTIVVSVKVDKTPTRLRVSITHKINNSFAGLIGFPTATISRSSVADWAEPVPLGSPCNEFGNDPDSPNTSGVKSTRCAGADQFWANIGSPAAAKGNGDAFQNGTCSGEDSCSGTTNADYDANGYFYTVNVEQATTNLRIDVFDPALISVGDLCDSSQSDNSSIQNAAKLKPSTDKNPEAVVPDPATRYAAGPDSPYCTGDISYNAKNQRDINQVSTSYTIRNPPANPWDPLSGTVRTDCTGAKTYPGYAGDLSKALNQKHADYKVVTPGFGQGYVAQVFRRWVPLCTIASAPAGTYTIQVHTNGVGQDYAAGHNRFALRAYSTTDSTAKDKVSVSRLQQDGDLRQPAERHDLVLPDQGAGRCTRPDLERAAVRHRRLHRKRNREGRAPTRLGPDEVHGLQGLRRDGRDRRHQPHRLCDHREQHVQRQVADRLGPDPDELHLQLERADRLLGAVAVRLRQRQPAE